MSDHNDYEMSKRTQLLLYIIGIVFFILACGQFYIYRSQMKINEMLAEGLMQIKEQKQPNNNLSPIPEESGQNQF